ncbi:MAG: hypothetical protein ABIS17_04560, partial [Casimicrobiaceae bacterium]
MACNAVKRLMAYVVGALLIAVASSAAALEGRVIDGSTGKPLEGVYVIGAWQVTTFLPVHSVSACAKLDLTRTDRNGRFVTPDHSGRLLPRLFGTESLNVYYFFPGYRFERGKEWLNEPVILVRDNRTNLARLGLLAELTTKADC